MNCSSDTQHKALSFKIRQVSHLHLINLFLRKMYAVVYNLITKKFWIQAAITFLSLLHNPAQHYSALCKSVSLLLWSGKEHLVKFPCIKWDFLNVPTSSSCVPTSHSQDTRTNGLQESIVNQDHQILNYKEGLHLHIAVA